jgi:hypothetical protein
MSGVSGLLIYTVVHSFNLAMEMFTLHVVLTSSPDSVFSFIFYNNFSEIKITVFKKTSLAGYFSYACNDAVERVQMAVYLSNILLTTKRAKQEIAKYCLLIFCSEILTDQLKHFFLTRFNKELDTSHFHKFRLDLKFLQKAFRKQDQKEIEHGQGVVRKYQSAFRWEMH